MGYKKRIRRRSSTTTPLPRSTMQRQEGTASDKLKLAASIYATDIIDISDHNSKLSEKEMREWHKQKEDEFMQKLSIAKLDDESGMGVRYDAKPAVDDKAAAADNGEGVEYVKLQDAAQYFAERMLLEEQFNSSLTPEESNDRYIGYAEKMKLELADSTIMYNAKPAAGAKPAVSFDEAFPGVVAALHNAVTKMCMHACYKYTEAEPEHLNEESDEEYKRRAIGYYNEMKACLSDTISSIPQLIQDAYAIDIQSTEAEAGSRKRKLEWIVPACDYWSDDENDEQSAPSKKSSRK